jgi:hypothetical protein
MLAGIDMSKRKRPDKHVATTPQGASPPVVSPVVPQSKVPSSESPQPVKSGTDGKDIGDLSVPFKKWRVKVALLVTVVAGLFGVVVKYWFVPFFDNSVNEQVDKRMKDVVDQSETRTRMHIDQAVLQNKQDKEEADLYRRTQDFLNDLEDLVCMAQYDAAINGYIQFTNSIAPRSIPNSFKRKFYKQVVRSLVSNRTFDRFNETMLEEFDNHLRISTTPCAAPVLYHLAILYATVGNLEKSRSLLSTSIRLGLPSHIEQTPDSNLHFYYAAYVLVDIAQSSNLPIPDRISRAWRMLTGLEEKYIVGTDSILSALNGQELVAVRQILEVQRVDGYSMVFEQIQERLAVKSFRTEEGPKGTGPRTVEFDTPKPPRIPRLGIDEGKGKEFELPDDPKKVRPTVPKVKIPDC